MGKNTEPLEIEYIQAAQDNIDRLQLEQNKLDLILNAIDTNPNNIRPLCAKFMYHWRKS